MVGYPAHIYKMMEGDQEVGRIEQWIPNLPQSPSDQCNRQIAHLNVHSERRGIGYGRKLVEHFEQKSREQGLDFITVCSSPMAEKFYEHLGFKKSPCGLFRPVRYLTGIHEQYYKPLYSEEERMDYFFRLTDPNV